MAPNAKSAGHRYVRPRYEALDNQGEASSMNTIQGTLLGGLLRTAYPSAAREIRKNKLEPRCLFMMERGKGWNGNGDA